MNDPFKKVKRTMIAIASLSLLVGATTLAHAITIDGIVTDSTGTIIDGSIGTVVGDKYEYYIPLSGSNGIYGVSSSGSYGESSDSATAPFTTAPIMDMYFHFDIALGQEGKSISLWTDDLDLKPSNDPNNFFERLFIYSDIVSGGNSGDFYEDYNVLGNFSNVLVEPDPVVKQNAVKVTFNNLNISSGSYLLHIGFQVYDELSGGTWTNTAEHISVQMETAPVPEPGTLILMGSGLVGILFFRRKIKNTPTV